MALIHEELYKGEGFERLNFSPYIDELAENLLLTYRLGNTDVSLNIDLEENPSFDMQLVTSLVDQLDGELELKRDNGAEFVMRFKLTENENQASTPAYTIDQITQLIN